MIFLTSLNNIKEVKSIEYNTKRYIVIKIILHIYPKVKENVNKNSRPMKMRLF